MLFFQSNIIYPGFLIGYGDYTPSDDSKQLIFPAFSHLLTDYILYKLFSIPNGHNLFCYYWNNTYFRHLDCYGYIPD